MTAAATDLRAGTAYKNREKDKGADVRAKRDRVPVTMFLMNGFQMRGTITGFDAFVVVLDSEGRQQVVYKHAISTIAPVRPVEISAEETE